LSNSFLIQVNTHHLVTSFAELNRQGQANVAESNNAETTLVNYAVTSF
jgi:hypothetical protein